MSIETGRHGTESSYPNFQGAIDHLSWAGDAVDRFFPTTTFHYNVENSPGQNGIILSGHTDDEAGHEVRCTAGRRVIIAPENMQTLQVIDVLSEPQSNRPGVLRVSDLVETREGYSVATEEVHEYTRGMVSRPIAIPDSGFIKVVDTLHTVSDEPAWQVTMLEPRTPQQDSEFYIAYGVHEALGPVEVNQ